MTLKNSIVSLLACACAAPLFADGDSEAALLAAADSAKAELSALKAELAARLDSNAVKKTSIANMKSVISQQEWVLAAASGKKSGKPWKAEAVKESSNVLMDIPFASQAELPKGLKLPSWASIENAPDGRPALKVSVDAAVMERTKGVNNIPFYIKSEDLGGRELRCHVEALGDGVAKAKPSHILGGKFMMNYVDGGKTCWPGAQVGEGSFPWRKLSFAAKPGSSVESVCVYLGMQGATGTIWFRNLKVEAVGNE